MLRDCPVCARSSGRTVLSWLARRNLCQAPVMGPEGAAGKPCRSQQVGIDVADATSHQLLLLNHHQDFRVAGHRGCRQALEQVKHLPAIAQVAAGEFADHPGVNHHRAFLQERCQTGHPTAQVIHPHRGVDEDQRVLRRRGIGSSLGSLPPRAARRRALSRCTRACRACLSSALRSSCPHSSWAWASSRSSSVTVVRIGEVARASSPAHHFNHQMMTLLTPLSAPSLKTAQAPCPHVPRLLLRTAGA